jgi:MYXO-CTERM domain-containing protein
MRSAVRSTVLSFVAVGVSVWATPASADTAATACEATSLDCSRGATTLHAESRDAVISSIGTGWMAACATPDPAGHCGSDQPIQVLVSMDLAAIPTPSTEPLWMVEMARTAVVDAHWPSTKSFDLTLAKSKVLDGTFKVSHTLIPAVHVHASLLGLTKDWTYDASKFLIDYAANFHYKATNTVTFLPWAFDAKVTNIVPAPSLTTTELLNVKLINDGNNNVDLGLSASTTPTFEYTTTKVTLLGATPITPASKTAALAMSDADFLLLDADVEGEITVAGELIAAPYISINKIGGITVPGGLGVLDLTSLVNAPKKAYTAAPPVAVKFPRVKIRIPLPNVKAPASVDLGSAQLGKSVEQPATIKNTGELAATMKFVSSDPQFTVVAAAGTDAKKDYALAIKFTPSKEGAQSATITVKSNDPDQPSQTIAVTANGTAVPVPPAAAPDAPPSDEPYGRQTDSGCGCHTVPVSSSSGALAGLALLGALALRRRRPRAS